MADSPDANQLQEILQRAARGDEAAWRVLVDVYTPRVFGLLRVHCGLIDLAEEITQSTFCTIVAKLAGYDEVGKFESWLFRIAMNRLRDEMRRRKRHAMSVEDETLAGLAEGSPAARVGVSDPSEHVDEDEMAALNRAIAQLSEADRRIIHLRHTAELSFKQISEVLEQPVGTVLARHHRALKKLRDMLSIQGIEP